MYCTFLKKEGEAEDTHIELKRGWDIQQKLIENILFLFSLRLKATDLVARGITRLSTYYVYTEQFVDLSYSILSSIL